MHPPTHYHSSLELVALLSLNKIDVKGRNEEATPYLT
uniref:Putative sugar phosphate/phosphate translocator At3g11320 isoform X1 n=1 Tax=Rhizophora mucronata TaxID=61149 RepID=A0A2P2JEN7_RHIMU